MRLCGALVFVAMLAIQPGLAQGQPGIYYGPSEHSPTGPAVDGFALSLRPEASTFHLGSPIWVTLEVRNVSGEPLAVLPVLRDDWDVCCGFTVISRKTGAVVPAGPNMDFGDGAYSGPGVGRPLSPGKSEYARFPLGVLYRFVEPGTYSVQVTKGQLAIHYKVVMLH